MMNEVCTNFIQVLSDFLNQRASGVMATPELIKYAKNHQVSAIFYQQLKTTALQQSWFFTIFQYKNRLVIEQKIAELFDQAGIRYFFVKGNDVAAYYPHPELRSMGDSDIVVDDVERAWNLLLANGFDGIRKDYMCEWPCYKGDFRIELQSMLAYTGSKKTLTFFNTCWQHENNHHLDWSFHFIYLLEHLRKHLVSEGVGFRQFMDLAVIVKNAADQLDWKWIRRQLQYLELWNFAETCLGLIHAWFEVELPVRVPELPADFYTFASERILEDGVFGTAKQPERAAAADDSEHGNGRRQAKTSTGNLLHKVFPPYEQLIVWRQYRFITGRRYLLPVCWVYRIFRHVFHLTSWKNLFLHNGMSGMDDSELSQWGL